jgi:hypothetical protein
LFAVTSLIKAKRLKLEFIFRGIEMLRRFSKVISLATAIVTVVSLNSGRAYADTPSPLNSESVEVRLPRSLDPSQQILHLKHGTRVFALKAYMVTYTRTENGSTKDYSELVSDVVSIERGKSSLVLTTNDGSSAAFPSDARIESSPAWAFAFFENGQPVTKQFLRRTPDYVVP